MLQVKIEIKYVLVVGKTLKDSEVYKKKSKSYNYYSQAFHVN